MSILIQGALTDQAEHRRTTAGEAVLILSFSTGHGFPFETRLLFGKTERDHLNAAAQAAILRKGMLIECNAMAAEPRTDHGHAAIALRKLGSLTIDGRKYL